MIALGYLIELEAYWRMNARRLYLRSSRSRWWDRWLWWRKYPRAEFYRFEDSEAW